MDPMFYNRAEAATGIGISIRSLDKLIASGEIAAVKIGARVLIPREELAGYLAGLPRARRLHIAS